MGFDKLLSFFMKNLQNNVIEYLYNKPIVVTNHIYFDMNFIVYNSISNIENDVNNIYKLILAIPYTNINIIETKLQNIFNTYHWKQVTVNINMMDIMDGNNINEIMGNFNKMITVYIYDIFYWDVYNSISQYIKSNHPKQFIRSINLFLDGIPTYAKILEQRRRRMKNYIDSKNRKKIFDVYFENIVHDIIIEDDIVFDYFEWLKHLFSFDKSIGPYSDIMILLGDFVLGKIKEEYPDILVILNNSTNNGESDYKIFKHIKDNKIDCDVTIHSCDSDFIFMIVWYQLLCNTSSIDINIMMIYYNMNSYYKNTSNKIINTLISGKKINNLLLEKYNMINDINTDVNINIIYDLLLLILMFGNDIIPPSYELGTELNLKLLFETHYILYQTNSFIINVNSINIINFTNLSKWLKLIKERNSFSIIILNRFYKLPYNIIINLTEKYDISNIINMVLIPYHIKMIENKTIESTDFRATLKSDIIYNNMLKDSHIEDYIDIMNSKDYGLIRVDKNFDIESNPYQTLYNYIANIAYNTEHEFNRPPKIFFDNLMDATKEYKEISKSSNTKQYLELLISLCHIFFHNFDLYTPYSLFHYSENIAPSIDMIIDFIDNNNVNDMMESCYNKSKTTEKYFNPISHHLFITPYLLESKYLDSIKNIEYINSLLNVVSTNIPGIWYVENETFILKKFDPIEIITLSNSMIRLYQDKIINNIFKSSDNLLY